MPDWVTFNEPNVMGRWATYWENFLLAEEAKSALPSV